jgi:hypothetical protein
MARFPGEPAMDDKAGINMSDHRSAPTSAGVAVAI